MQTTQFEFDAIGTKWHIDIADKINSTKREKILSRIIEKIEEFDQLYSRFRTDSWVRQLATKKGIYELPQYAKELLLMYQKLYELTDGSFTPLIGQLLSDAGYDETYSLTPKKLSKPPKWEDVISNGKNSITITQPVLLDFGAGGKGYLIDLVGMVLQKEGVETYCIEAGGDILYQTNNQPTLRVGLEDPDDPTQVIGIAQIKNESICASAGNRRKWGNYHHIINPQTLHSVFEIKATWVIAENAFLADVLSTCLFFTSAEVLLRVFDFSYVIVDKNNSVTFSSGFPGEIFAVPQ